MEQNQSSNMSGRIQPPDEIKGQVAVITDSVAQVPPKIAEDLNITVVPYTVIINDKLYKDGADLSPRDFYRRMRSEKIVPHTTHPSAGEYLQVFRDCLVLGAKSILYVVMSSSLSGAYSTAIKTAEIVMEEFPNQKIEIIDTHTATICQGFIAIEAARTAAQGASLGQVIEATKGAIPHAGFVASLETLEYLARGGRIGKASFMMGSMIKIKPILTIDKDGTVYSIIRVRGEGKTLEKMVELVAERIQGKPNPRLAIMEADIPETAERLRALALERIPVQEIIVTDFTPVMGAHAGPGVIGLAYIYDG